MFSNIHAGWVDFELPGTHAYGLSYLSPVPFEWLDAAIHGLETLQPFCVKGYLEPGRMICTVSYHNSYVVCEDEEYSVQYGENPDFKCSSTGMLEFCQQLADDIRRDLDAWVGFCNHRGDSGLSANKQQLMQKLERLRLLIEQRREALSGGSMFIGWQ